MTCIVGIVSEGKVYIGGDSAGVSDLNVTVRKDPKVFKNGEFLIGYTGSFRMGQLLRYQCNFPAYSKDFYEDEYHYMCTDFIEEIRQVLKQYGYTRIDSNEESGGFFLAGFRGRLFEIESDFQVGESIKPYSAIGCGMCYALGSLYAYEKYLNDDPLGYIEHSLKAAEEFSGGVKGPFIIESIGD